MKNLIIVSLVVIISGCALFLGAGATPFKVEAVTSQKWYAGMAGGGKGTNYAFELKMRKTEGVKFDTVWLNGYPFTPILQEPSEEGGNHRLIMTLSERPKNEEGQEKQQWVTSPKKAEDPPEFEGTAMIIYRFEGEKRALIVDEKIEQKERLSYP